ncbi:MAG: hypothetical protein QOH81_433 [Sphingomonadales bacterium]|jgi:hypothetical protein|nr:hypothetical protein [Sphingomonadales bacterium]
MAGTAQATDRDIDYLRQLAESGAHAPLLGGRFLTWWGLLVAVAYGLHHLALHRVIGNGSTIFAFIWIGFSVIGMGGQFVLARGAKPKAGSGSAGNRASRVVWVAGACSIASMVVGAAVAAGTGAGPATFDWTVPVAFAVYASALIVTGSLARSRIALAAGGGAVLMVGLFTAMILSPDRYLLASAGVALTVLLPGLLLLRSEPR